MEAKRKISGKGIVITGIILVFFIPARAQNLDTLQNLPNLLLPKFTRGIVRMKNGGINSAILNYDLVGQRMVFLQRNLTLVLDKPQEIDTIFLANRTFVPFEKGFYEILVKAPLTLFKENKCYLELKGTPIGFGAISQTTGPSYIQQIYGPTGAINLMVPFNYKVVDDSEYWIRRDGSMLRFSSRKQFLRNFPERAQELKQHIRRSKTDFGKTEDVVALVMYLNELYR